MKRHFVVCADREHLKRMVKTYRDAGYQLVTYTETLVEMETLNGDEFIRLEVYRDGMGNVIERYMRTGAIVENAKRLQEREVTR